MGLRLPTADTNFKQKQAILAKFAANIWTLMGNATGVANFPSPPTPLVGLVALINAYSASLATARHGSKEDTSNKNIAKQNLIAALRTNALYVTQVSQNTVLGGAYNNAQINFIKQFILTSGYKLSKAPVPVANVVGPALPLISGGISKEVGSFYVLLRQYTRFKKGTKVFQLRYRTAASGMTPAGPWVNVTFTTGRITVGGLTSGKTYDWQVGAVGGINTKTGTTNPVNYTPLREVVVT